MNPGDSIRPVNSQRNNIRIFFITLNYNYIQHHNLHSPVDEVSGSVIISIVFIVRKIVYILPQKYFQTKNSPSI